LSIGGDAIDDAFNGSLNLTSSGGDSRLIKIGNETLTLGGTTDNANGRAEVRGGTLVLAKDSSGTVRSIGGSLLIGDADAGIETARIGGTYVGAGSVNLPNYRDQIFRGVTVTVTNSGVLDLNGNGEAFNVLSGNGTVSNSVAATGTLMLGQNNPGAFTFTGSLNDGAGKLSFWKAGSSNISLNGANVLNASSSGGTATSTSTLTMGSVTTLTPNMLITGTGIPNNTRVTAVDAVNGTITLSNPTSAATTAATSYNFFANGTTSTGATATNASAITVADTTGLSPGMLVNGVGVQAGTRIASISSNIITLDAPTYTATTGVTGYSFANGAANTLTGDVLVARAALVLSGSGGRISGAAPIIVSGGTGGSTLFLDNTAVTSHALATQTNSTATTSGTSTITMSGVTNLAVGMGVSGTGIQGGTVITAISGNDITLSRATNAIAAVSSTFTFSGRGEVAQFFSTSSSSGGTASGSATITMANASALIPGMFVSGTGIAPGTTVSAKVGNVITLSKATTALTSAATAYTFANQDRISDSSPLTLDKGGNLTVRRSSTITANGGDVFENFGTLQVQNGSSVIRTDHSDGGTSTNIIPSTIGLRFSDYTRQTGGTVAFTEQASSGTYFSATSPQTATTQYLLGNLPGSTLLVGDSDASSADVKVLIGAYGTLGNNSGIDRLMTVQTIAPGTVGAGNYIRPIADAEFVTNITGATTLTTSNLGGTGTSTRDDNARIAANYTLNIAPVANQLTGRTSYNAWWQTGSTVTIGEQNALHLGGFTADALILGWRAPV
jgi:hypothetical protein